MGTKKIKIVTFPYGFHRFSFYCYSPNTTDATMNEVEWGKEAAAVFFRYLLFPTESIKNRSLGAPTGRLSK